MFQISDLVVYRRQVCRIMGIAKSEYTGEPCYMLEPFGYQDCAMRMQVPVSNKAGHLRPLMDAEQIEELFFRAQWVQPLDQNRTNLKNAYIGLLNTDSLEDLICLIKTAGSRCRIRQLTGQKITPVDVEYLDKAREILFTEIGISLHMSPEAARARYEERLYQREH